jgi:hypothetical protein
MNVSLHRINNNEYLGNREHGRSIRITTNPLINAEIAYCLALKAVERAAKSHQPKTVRFRYGGKKWKVVPINERSQWQRFLRFINIFSVKPVEGRCDRYRLESAHLPLRKQRQKAKRTVAGHALSNALKSGLRKDEFQNGIREKIADGTDLKSFSQISAKAFQRHETFFCPKDDTKLAHLDYRIIVKDGGLELVHKKSNRLTASNSKEVPGKDSMSNAMVQKNSTTC